MPHPLVKIALSIALVARLLLDAAPVHATTFEVRALSSNILVDGKRVIFTQATGSLTVLDLDTGDVLLRKKLPRRTPSYRFRFQSCADGVLMMSHDYVALLDRDTFDPIWQHEQIGDVVADGEHVVSCRDHTVTCRKTRTGKESWTLEMEYGCDLVAGKGRVAICSPGYSQPAVLLVADLESGQTLMRHDGPVGAHWRVYFDGEFTTMLADKRTLTTLNLQGKVVDEIDFRSPQVLQSENFHRYDSLTFLWNDTYFDHDRQIRHVSPRERKTLMKLLQRQECYPEVLPSVVFAGVPSSRAAFLLEAHGPSGSWHAYAPYLMAYYHQVSQVSEGNGKLLVGANSGHVECFDIPTGQSRWLYAFPTITVMSSYSPGHGGDEYISERAASYQGSIARLNRSRGSIPVPLELDLDPAKKVDLPAGEYAGRVVIDPSPDDPYAVLVAIYYRLAACTLLPALGIVWLLRRLAKRVALHRESFLVSEPPALRFLVGFVVLSIPPAIGWMIYGNASYVWNLALKATVAMAILGGAYAIKQHRWEAIATFLWIWIPWGLFLIFIDWVFWLLFLRCW
jgi:hypothetical protein